MYNQKQSRQNAIDKAIKKFGHDKVDHVLNQSYYSIDSNDEVCRFLAESMLNDALISTYPFEKSIKYIHSQLIKLLPQTFITDQLKNLQPSIDNHDFKNVMMKLFDTMNYNSNNMRNVDKNGILPKLIVYFPVSFISLEEYSKYADDIEKYTRRKIENMYLGLSSINKNVEKIANYVGYTLASEISQMSKDMHGLHVFYLQILLEANYYNQILVTDTIIPRHLYHITTYDLGNKILKKGLIPRANSKIFKYKSRVYLFAEKDMKLAITYIKQSDKSNSYNTNNDHMMLLTIDKTKLKDNTIFSQDAMFDNVQSFWTYSNIPKEAIVNSEIITDEMQINILKSIEDEIENRKTK